MLNLIGKDVIRLDGWEKVTGKALYGEDLKFPGLLYAACRYVDISCGTITNIELDKAKKIEGVCEILLAKDLSYNLKIGPIRQDQNVLITDRVYFQGDVVALVAAETLSAAYQACEAIRISYKPEEGIYELEKAENTDSKLVHPEYKSNVVIHYPLRKGNIKQGFKEAEKIITRTYRTGFVEHAYIEPETVIAIPDSSTSGIKLYGSIQNPFTTRRIMSQCLKYDLNRINVCASTLGGSFGGKDDIINVMACRAAILAIKTGKPVKLTNSRENSIRESYKRHPYLMKYKVGFKNTGKLTAMDISILADSGAYSSQSFFVTWRSVVQATGPYEIDHVETNIKALYTNNCYTAAFRGFGSPQIIFAQESLMDEIAAICNISPIRIRKLNRLRTGSITATGQVLKGHKVSLNNVLNAAIKESGYSDKLKRIRKANQKSLRYKYGIGLACSFRGCSLGAEGTDATSAIVSVQADGSVYLIAALHENGQGLKTTFCLIAAEELGITLEKVVFLEPSTAIITDGGPTVASRATLMGGKAVQIASRKVKQEIFKSLKDKLGVTKLSETSWYNGNILNKNKVNPKSISFHKAAELASKDGRNLSAYGWYKSPDVSWDEKRGQGKAYFTYVYGCQIAEIKLDQYTGKIEVEKVTAAHDAGRIINKLGAEGQVYGGVTQGIGYGILEDINSAKGIIRARNFDEYLIPTIKDVNKITPVFVENPDKYGPFGAKSLGEPTLELTAAAINNAVSLAAGKRFYQIPLTLEQVYLGKMLSKPERKSEQANKSHRKSQPFLNNITVKTPVTIKEALEFMKGGKSRVLAGGTDLIIKMRFSKMDYDLIDLHNLSDLKYLSRDKNNVRIGALTTFSELISNPLIKNHFPVLVEACRLIGSTQIRNRATIGGNIVNAAACADSVPPLMLYDARVYLHSQKGKRCLRLVDFITGSYRTSISKDEILTEILIPLPEKVYKSEYYQLGRRNAVNITRMSLGILIYINPSGFIKECRIVQGSLFPSPSRMTELEEFLQNKKITPNLAGEIKSILISLLETKLGNHWSAQYKIPVFYNIFKESLINISKQV